MKIEIGWKVVRWDFSTSKYRSYVKASSNVDYSTRFWTRPRRGCGPLCVFRTRRLARNFEIGTDRIIFKCKFQRSDFEKIWDFEDSTGIYGLPTGTILASKVKLLYRG